MGKPKRGNYMFQAEIQENYSGKTTRIIRQAASKKNHWEAPLLLEPKVIEAEVHGKETTDDLPR